VCGPAAFVEAATSAPGRKRPATNTIRTERFGPTAG
jgi:ferredoxin-NADP reductase